MGLIVEQGIAHDLRLGSVAAWRFMSSNGVPEDLILRVLSDPLRRRASDSAALGVLHHEAAHAAQASTPAL